MTNTASLHTMKEDHLEFADPAEDIRGHKVLDKDGRHIGKVDGLVVDDDEHKVRFLKVATGGFLGLSQTRFLIPVDAITAIDDLDRLVQVDCSREHVAAGPGYDPDLLNHVNAVLDYYGTSPYWSVGYLYPGYPYYL